MRELLGRLATQFLPPVLSRLLRRRLDRGGYFGDFPHWQAARELSTGYDARRILEKVRSSLAQVKAGKAAYERDSVLFDEVQYAWPLLAALLWVASRHGNSLKVLDFGGSLGSSYFQNRHFLSHLETLEWSIVEQEEFVECGKREFEDTVLRFFHTVQECAAARSPDCFLLCSVLPYLEEPYRVLRELLLQKPAYIIVDRTPVLEGERDRITVQRVPEEIYGGSYPAWFLSRSSLLAFLEREYRLVAEFDALGGCIDLGNEVAWLKGFIFARRA